MTAKEAQSKEKTERERGREGDWMIELNVAPKCHAYLIS